MSKDTTYLEHEFKSTKVIGFKLGVVELAINIKSVQEVIPLSGIRKIPRAPKFIDGVISQRGEIIPVIDLRRFLWIKPNTSKTPLVIVYNLKHVRLGFVVDEVSNVIQLDSSKILPPPPVKIKELHKKCIHGLFEYKNDNILLIDLSKLLSSHEEAMLNKISQEA